MRAVQILGDLATHFLGLWTPNTRPGTRTQNLKIRSLALYPIEPAGHNVSFLSSDNSVSDTGTRTPARGVKTLDPNQLDYIGLWWGVGPRLTLMGIEPISLPCKGSVLTTTP